MVLKQVKNNKASGPSGVSAEMFKALGHDGVDWLYTVVNEFWKTEKLPDDLKESEYSYYLQAKG